MPHLGGGRARPHSVGGRGPPWRTAAHRTHGRRNACGPWLSGAVDGLSRIAPLGRPRRPGPRRLHPGRHDPQGKRVEDGGRPPPVARQHPRHADQWGRHMGRPHSHPEAGGPRLLRGPAVGSGWPDAGHHNGIPEGQRLHGRLHSRFPAAVLLRHFPRRIAVCTPGAVPLHVADVRFRCGGSAPPGH
jgi:hypothetical protein